MKQFTCNRKLLISILIFCISYSAISQHIISGKIIDSYTSQALEFCNVYKLETGKGSISNEEGSFEIEVSSLTDLINFSYLGYETISLKAEDVIRLKIIELVPNTIVLQEFTVFAEDDYLYEVILKCQKQFKRNQRIHLAKAYYGIQTESNNQPLELLECYYNAESSGQQIKTLNFKAGRTGLAKGDNGYFQSYNTAKAISKLPILYKSDYYPGNPLQYSKAKMKKLYRLESYIVDSNMMFIKFYPKQQINELFSGEIWLDKTTYNIFKIELLAENTDKYPFEAKHKHHSISDVSLKISNTYTINSGFMVIAYINFEYAFRYHSKWGYQDNLTSNQRRDIIRNIKSKGIITLYDYEQGFIIPYFSYPDNLYYGDYFRIEFTPYNAIFWSENNQILLSKNQKENLGFFAENGKLTNYWDVDDGFSTIKELHPLSENSEINSFFGFQYIYWNPEKRLVPKLNQTESDIEKVQKQDYTNKETQVNLNKVSNGSSLTNTFKRDLYNLKSQLFLDVTRIGDSLYCKTYTVFDTYNSFYALEKHPATNAFINIFFDICEIERRKLESNLLLHTNTIEVIDSIYFRANESMADITNRYFNEVETGRNQIKMKKWNEYVYENLGIDNLQLLENTLKFKNQ